MAQQRREPIRAVPADHVTSAANVAAVITLAADPNRRHELSGLFYSYSAAPTGGLLTITIDAAIVRQWHVAAADERGRGYNPPLETALNEAMEITLAAAGAGVVGELNVDVESIHGRV